MPLRKKKEAIEKAIRHPLADMMPANARYLVLRHESKSNFDLQIVDYCNWALFRKWKDGDERSYGVIAPAVQSEFDIFRTGKTYNY